MRPVASLTWFVKMISLLQISTKNNLLRDIIILAGLVRRLFSIVIYEYRNDFRNKKQADQVIYKQPPR